ALRLPVVHHRLARAVVRDLPGGLVAASWTLRPCLTDGHPRRALLPRQRYPLAGGDRSAGRDGRGIPVAKRLLPLRLGPLAPSRRFGPERVHGPVLRRSHL